MKKVIGYREVCMATTNELYISEFFLLKISSIIDLNNIEY